MGGLALHACNPNFTPILRRAHEQELQLLAESLNSVLAHTNRKAREGVTSSTLAQALAGVLRGASLQRGRIAGEFRSAQSSNAQSSVPAAYLSITN
jgi:hypothetical protein